MPMSDDDDDSAGTVSAALVGESCAGGDWEMFVSAVRLLRRCCMLAANRSDLLALKVKCCYGALFCSPEVRCCFWLQETGGRS